MTGGEAALTFSYTADRRACMSFVSSFVVLLLAESLAVGVLILVLVPGTLVKVLLLGALLAAVVGLVFGFLLAPLWTRHTIGASHLELHYGLDRMRIPCQAIVDARPAREPLPRAYLARAVYDPGRARLTAAFSDSGEVLLSLSESGACHSEGRRVREVLINVDDQAAFLSALADRVPPPAAAGVGGGADARAEEAAMPPPGASPGGRMPGRNGSRRAGPAVQAIGLRRAFGGFAAVDGVNLEVHAGEIYGFLGMNGAGKTTTIRMLVGLLEPSAGRALIMGHDVRTDALAAKTAYGYVPDRAILYDRLTGREFLQFLGQMRELPKHDVERRANVLLDALDLAPAQHTPCGVYSLGMKRKLALAAALLHEPAVLILDEPLNGLDPVSARRLKDLLAELAGRGTAVLLSTHDLAAAEAVCHRVGIIHRGRLVKEGSAGELRSITRAPDLETVFLSFTDHGAAAARP